MTTEAASIFRNLFDNFWRLFNSFYIPGTRMTPAAMLLFIVVGGLVIRFIRSIVQQHRDKD